MPTHHAVWFSDGEVLMIYRHFSALDPSGGNIWPDRPRLSWLPPPETTPGLKCPARTRSHICQHIGLGDVSCKGGEHQGECPSVALCLETLLRNLKNHVYKTVLKALMGSKARRLRVNNKAKDNESEVSTRHWALSSWQTSHWLNDDWFLNFITVVHLAFHWRRKDPYLVVAWNLPNHLPVLFGLWYFSNKKFFKKKSKITHAQVAKLCAQSDVHHTIPRRIGTSQKLCQGANISSPVAKHPQILGVQSSKILDDQHMAQYSDRASWGWPWTKNKKNKKIK